MVKKNIKLIKGWVLIILYLFGSTESQLHVGRLETEVKERSSQMEALSSQLQEIKVEKAQLVEQLASINSLLEASQANKEDKNQVGHHFFFATCQTSSHALYQFNPICHVLQQGKAAELDQLRLR